MATWERTRHKWTKALDADVVKVLLQPIHGFNTSLKNTALKKVNLGTYKMFETVPFKRWWPLHSPGTGEIASAGLIGYPSLFSYLFKVL